MAQDIYICDEEVPQELQQQILKEASDLIDRFYSDQFNRTKAVATRDYPRTLWLDPTPGFPASMRNMMIDLNEEAPYIMTMTQGGNVAVLWLEIRDSIARRVHTYNVVWD